ncbi:MAG: LamG domain-containing protein [Victivallaceae bacterium]|nr:LamG domain-containing protein [Victivallaceae bacterium]
MRNYIKCFTACVCAVTIFSVSFTAQGLPQQPHLQRQGTNLVSNPDINGSTGWVLGGSTVYDSTVSKEVGTGSLKLTIPYTQTNYSYINSGLIPVTPGLEYTLSYSMRSDSWPSPIPNLYVAYYDASQNYIRNSFGSLQAVTTADTWQECTYLFRPVAGEVYVKIKSTLMEFPIGYSGTVWLDSFYLGTGIGFEQPPTAKKPFDGSMTRVDALGNVEINKNSVWTPFFPIGIYGDGNRPDWADYSSQGFNTQMWVSVDSAVQKAKDAGMMSNFDLSGYIVLPNDVRYNNLTLLESRINAIKSAGLMDSLLFYYCDNENAYDEWDVPISVTNKVRDLDRDANNNLMHPIYFLQGNEGVARKYNTSSISINDIVGDYVTHDNPSTSPEENRGAFGLITLDNIEGQQAPVVMAQINIGVGMRFRARLFTAIAKGAKGVGFWRDTYYAPGATVDPTRPPIEDQLWWNDLPAINSEINQMLPIIRMPHWTTWSLASSSSLINFGTRDYEGRGYIIVTNESATAITTTFTLTSLPYTATAARNFFTGIIAANISNSQFTVTVPAYGSLVLQLENELDATTVLKLPFDEADGSTTADSSYFANDGTLVNDAALGDGTLSLDGTGDYVNCGVDASTEMGTDDMTIIARVKLSSTQGTHVGIVTKGAGATTDEGYAFLYNPSANDLRLYISNGSDTRIYLNSNSNLGLNDNQWHTVAVSLTRNGDAVFYVDGVNAGSESASSLDGTDISNSSRDLLVGSWINSWHLNGNVDNVRIYKKALTVQEITDLSEATLYLTMNKSNNIAPDDSIYGNDGIAAGDASMAFSMLNLDGTGDRLNCGADASLEMGTGDMTIVARIKLVATQNTYVGIVTKGAGSGTDGGYALIYYSTTGTLIFPVSDGNGTRPWLTSNSNLDLNDNQWHTVAVSLTRSGNAVFYVDGVNVGSTSATTINGTNISNSSRDLLIGSWINNWHLNGSIDNARIYKRALTAQEIAEL